MRILLASTLVLALLVAVDASCAVYMWEDEQGVTAFTEDYGKIPKKYRNKAKKVEPDQPDDSEAAPVVDTQGTKAVVESPVNLKGGSGATTPAKAEKKQLFGGKEESYWFNEFGKLKADLRSYKDQLDAITARLNNSSQMSRAEYKSLENTRKLLEEQEGAARRRFESLTDQANKAGVPQDLR
jgi:hypothetical protein